LVWILLTQHRIKCSNFVNMGIN